jgi:hypothetical protein
MILERFVVGIVVGVLLFAKTLMTSQPLGRQWKLSRGGGSWWRLDLASIRRQHSTALVGSGDDFLRITTKAAFVFAVRHGGSRHCRSLGVAISSEKQCQHQQQNQCRRLGTW